MAATLVGEAAIRIVPSLRGFKTQADTQLRKTKLEPVRVELKAETRKATAEMDEWRAKQDLKPVVVPVKANTKSFERDIKQIEHRVRDSPLHQLLSFNLKIVGLDVLPALAYAAASAAAGLDALGESALALPGIFGGVGASVGALALGLDGLKQAMSDYDQGLKTTSQHSHQVADDTRTLQRSYRDYRDAVRDTTREIQDLNAENRRSSLSKADALLSIQEAADRLRQGGFSTVTELKRAQLSYVESIDHYNDVLTRSNRTQEDANRANAQGVAGSDKVQAALDGINKSLEKLDNDKVGNFNRALANLSPNAQAAVKAIEGLRGEYVNLRKDVQDNLFAGMDKEITQLAQRTLPTLHTGLARVATGLNTDIKAAMQSAGSDSTKGFLTRIFGNDDAMLDRLSTGIKPLMHSVMELTAVSSDFLPRLGTAADKVFTRFDNWTDKISKDGSLRAWTDQGLQAMDDLGHIGTGIIGVIHQIGKAFDDVSGHQGGFLKTFSDELAKIQTELQSPEGLGKLETYLRGARQEWDGIRASWRDMKPTIKDLIGYAREWSQETMGMVGVVLHVISAIDRVTHALGPLMEYILVMRTLKQGFGIGAELISAANAPIRGVQAGIAWWDKLGKSAEDAGAKQVAATATTDAATTATKEAGDAAVTAAAEQESLGKKVEATSDKMDTASTRAKAMTTNITNFTSPARTAADAEEALGSNAERAGTLMEASGNKAEATGGQVGGLGAKAEEAGGKIGGGVGLMGKLGGLASALGPGMALNVAILATISVIGRLGDAHRRAAQDADTQKASLDGLADSLDRVSGAATPETLKQAIDSAKKYTVPGLPGQYKQRDLTQDITGTGTGITPQMYGQALIPANSGVRSQYLAQIDQKKAETIPQQDWYKRFKPQLDDAGLDPLTIAKALNGDPDATKKFTAFRDKQKHDHGYLDAPDWMPGAAAANQMQDSAGVAGGALVPDLTDILTRDPQSLNLSTSAQGLRGIGGRLDAQGAQNRDANDTQVGKWQLNDAGKAAFPFDIKQVTKDYATNQAVIVFAGDPPPGWDPDGELPDGRGTVTDLPGGLHRVELKKDETDRLLIPGYATGGMIRGPGSGTSDSILAKVSDGEHVSKAAAVKYYSPEMYDAMNNMVIPRDSLRAAMGLPHHKTGGWGGGSFKMDGPAPAPPHVDTFGPLVPDTGHEGGPQVVPGAPSKTPWHVAAPDPVPAPAPAPAPDLGFGGGKAGDITNPGLQGGPLDTSKLPGYHDLGSAPDAPVAPPGAVPGVPGTPPSYTPALPGIGTPAPPVAGVAPVMTPYGPMSVPGGGLTANSVIAAAQSVAGRVPYVWGGFSPQGFDCSGLAAWLANTATGRDPFGGGRFATGNEGPELAARGFVPGPGGPGEMTIGWNADHTGITLPDGEHIDAEDEKDGIVLNGHSPGATGFPNVMHLPGGGGVGMLPGGVPGALMDPSATPMSSLQFRMQNLFNPQNMMANIQGHYAQAYAPQNIMKFLGGQANNAGQQIMGIGLQLFGGLTGINLSSITGDLSTAGNYGLGMIQAPNGGTPGVTDLNSAAGGDISQFMGAGGLNVGDYGSQFAGVGGTAGTSGGGGEQYRPMIRQILQQYGPQFGIPPSAYSQWENDLVKQIDTESSGSATVTSAAGDHGILQFKPGTFDQFNLIPGASINDPQAQIVAALNRLTHGGPNAYQMNADGTPQQIGEGVGWATGGFPGGTHAWVSNGEFKSGSKATSYYGADVYNKLNAMGVSRQALGHFAGGGWPTRPVPYYDPSDGSGGSGISGGGGIGNSTATRFFQRGVPGSSGPVPGLKGLPHFADGGFPVAAPPPQLIQPGPPKPPVIPDIPNIQRISDSAQSALGAVGGALQGAAAGAGGGGGGGGQGESPTAPTTRMGPPQTRSVGSPPAPGDSTALPGPGGVVTSNGSTIQDNRGAVGSVGAAPTTNDHLNPAIKGAVSGAINSVAGLAASAVGMAGSAFGGPAGGAAGGAAGSLISGAGQIGAETATDALNILAGFAVKNQGPANGTPLVAQRKETQMAAPVAQRIHNGDVYTQNLHEWHRAQETQDAQTAMPYIQRYG